MLFTMGARALRLSAVFKNCCKGDTGENAGLGIGRSLAMVQFHLLCVRVCKPLCALHGLLMHGT